MKQLRDVSFLQTFGIILVVLGHSFFRFPADYPVIRWVYAFHMPLFFFLSGYLLKYTHPDIQSIRLTGRRGYFRRKARRLILPYVAISSAVFIPKALMSQYAVRPVALDLHSYIDQLLIPYHNVLGAYWFMPTLFLIFVCFILAAKLFGQRVVGSGAVLLGLVLVNTFLPFGKDSILNVLGVAHYMVYFAIGYDFRESRLETLAQRADGRWMLAATLSLSIALLFTPAFPLCDLLAALNGIALSIALSKIYQRMGWHFLDHLFGATYYIYLYSGIFQIFSLQVLLHFVSLPPVAYVPLGFLTGLYGAWGIYKLKGRLRLRGKRA